MVLWTSDARSSVRRRLLAALLVACVAALFALVTPRTADATGTPEISSWNAPSSITAGSNYSIRIYFAAPAASATWAQVSAGFNGSSNVVTVAQGATYADVTFHANDEGGWGNTTMTAKVGIQQTSGGVTENVCTDNDQAQALWAD